MGNLIKYSKADLNEFEILITEKIKRSKEEAALLKQTLSKENNGTDDTSWTFNMMEDGASTLTREETDILLAKQEKFIHSLEKALIRIKNGTYGICIATGELIPKERLKAVPHATMTINQKIKQQS